MPVAQAAGWQGEPLLQVCQPWLLASRQHALTNRRRTSLTGSVCALTVKKATDTLRC